MDISSLHLDMGGLIASLFWGGIGMGFLVYARKQRSIPALLGGVGLVGISYFMADSAVWMSLAGVGILIGVYYLSRRED
jgi:CHASE2 domain-containing sensor protein